jgi:hypothetical protein
MTDQRPQPKYGEYGEVANPAPPAQMSWPPPQPAKRRTWDLVLTVGLLVIGVYNVTRTIAGMASLGSTIATVYDQQGIGTFTSYELASQIAVTLDVASIILLVVAIIVSIARLRRNRIAFWVPLTAGVVNALVAVVGVLVVMLSDPAFSAYVNR